MIYIYIFFIFLVLAFLDINSSSKLIKIRTYVSVLMYLVVVLVSGLRWKTGSDWDPYHNYFAYNETIDDFLEYRFEYFYLLLNYIVKLITSSYSVLLFFTASLVVFLKWNTFFKLCRFPFVALLANASFFALDLFTVRQGIAIAVCVYSLRYIVSKMNIRFLICILFASMFHVTALVFAIAPLVFKLKLTSGKLIAFLAIAMLCSCFINFVQVLNYISSVFFSTAINDMVSVYNGSEIDISSGLSKNQLLLLQFFKATLTLIIFWNLCVKPYGSDIARGCFNLYYFYVIIKILFYFDNIVFMRFSMYFSVFEVFLIDQIFARQNKLHRILLFIPVSAYLTLKFVYGFVDNTDLFFPYETIFENNHKETY